MNDITPPGSVVDSDVTIPTLASARADWPTSNDESLYWIGLSTYFKYHNQPRINEKSEGSAATDKGGLYNFYCRPKHLVVRIQSFLEESDGGSILVTGYRGTGKSSLVSEAIRAVREKLEVKAKPEKDELTATKKGSTQDEKVEKKLLEVRVNLSTACTPHEVLSLSINRLISELDTFREGEEDTECESPEDQKKFTLSKPIGELKKIAERISSDSRVERSAPGKGPNLFSEKSWDGPRKEEEITFQNEALSIAQAGLRSTLQKLRAEKYVLPGGEEVKLDKIIFVFDEIDKFKNLVPLQNSYQDEAEGESNQIVQLQAIVSQLKSFLAESPSHQIFVAGKDADDNWAEDQNKGEGVLESLFAANVYVPSILSILKLEPCPKAQEEFFPGEGEEKATWTAEVYTLMAREIGISSKSLSFNTCFLVFPYLAEFETYQLLKRIQDRIKGNSGTSASPELPEVDGGTSASSEPLGKAAKNLFGRLKVAEAGKPAAEWETPKAELLPPMSERTCRRLKTLIEYLTYKGRGIPRKILRELYSLVQPSESILDGDVSNQKLKMVHWVEGAADCRLKLNIIALPTHQIQRMSFYSMIMDILDQSFNELSGLSDKGRVSIFHIVDYTLKFYTTGFSRRDIEHASFMTTREELFPSRPLATTILRIMEGKIWKRRSSLGEDFRLIHYVRHDLGVLFLRYAPEQMELRHTFADFRNEMRALAKSLERSRAVGTSDSTEPVHAQIRMGRIWELLGSHHEARLAYYKALKWIRLDLPTKKRSWDSSPGIDMLLSHALYTLLALGRLHEQVSENADAVRIYGEVGKLYHFHTYLPNGPTDARILGNSIVPVSELMDTLLPPEVPGRKKKEAQLLQLVQRNPPIAPSSQQASDMGYIRSLNQAAICYIKISERVSGSINLLQALFELDRIGDEQGLIEQMVLIAHVMVRRRDMRAASLWYLSALHRIKRIQDYANFSAPLQPRLQSGAEWQTPSIPKSIEAQIWAYLGDVCFATQGAAFLRPPRKEVKKLEGESAYDRVRKDLSDYITDLGHPIYEDRVFEYFFTTARHRYQEMGDPAEATNILMRQLEHRLTLFKHCARHVASQMKLNSKPETETEIGKKDAQILFELLSTWSGFWKGARFVLESQYLLPNSLARDRKHFRGSPGDNRRIGNIGRLIGEFLREVALYFDLIQEVFRSDESDGKDKKDEILRTFRFGRFELTEKDLETEAMVTFKKNPEDEKEFEERFKAIVRPERGKMPKIYAAVLGLILDADPENFPKEHPFLKGNRPMPERGIASPLFRINGGKAGKGCSLLLIEFLATIISEHPDSPKDIGILKWELNILAASEAALLFAYLSHRDSLQDFEQAKTTMEVSSLYHLVMYRVNARIPEEHPLRKEPKFVQCYDRLYWMAKRFAVRSIDILKREREQNRNTYTLLAEAFFGLGEVLLLRIAFLQSLEVEGGLGKDQLPKGDAVHHDVLRQAWFAFRDGLGCVLMEIEEMEHRYALPSDVSYDSGNLMDPVLHFRICRSVRHRHASLRGEKASVVQLKEMIRLINNVLSESMPASMDVEEWLGILQRRVDLAARLRTDRATTIIKKIGEVHKIVSVEPDDFGAAQRYTWFGPPGI